MTFNSGQTRKPKPWDADPMSYRGRRGRQFSDWTTEDERKHPRDNAGKFSSKGSTKPLSRRDEAGAHKKHLKTKSPYFKKWFGDSKVVDDNGEPLVVYHGTDNSFDEFKNPHAETSEWNMFSENPEYAENFAQVDGGNIKPAYVSIGKPFDLSRIPARRGDARNKVLLAAEMQGLDAELLDKILPYERDLFQVLNSGKYRDQLVSHLKENGFDGIKMPDAYGTTEATTWIVFHPSQIKSATGNTGEYDAGNDKIQFGEFSTGTLNPDFWRGDSLEYSVRSRLLQIAEAFAEEHGVPSEALRDVILTGSLANINWNPHSDVDLHLVVDFTRMRGASDFLKNHFQTAKSLWNLKHNITLHGHPVELYVQDATEPHYASGVYSLTNNRWLKEPKQQTPQEPNRTQVMRKADEFRALIDLMETLVINKDVLAGSKIQWLKDRLKRMRSAGLETGGEYSVENLAFKELRNGGHLEKLAHLSQLAEDRQYSLSDWTEEDEKKHPRGQPGNPGQFVKKNESHNAGIPMLADDEADEIEEEDFTPSEWANAGIPMLADDEDDDDDEDDGSQGQSTPEDSPENINRETLTSQELEELDNQLIKKLAAQHRDAWNQQVQKEIRETLRQHGIEQPKHLDGIYLDLHKENLLQDWDSQLADALSDRIPSADDFRYWVDDEDDANEEEGFFDREEYQQAVKSAENSSRLARWDKDGLQEIRESVGWVVDNYVEEKISEDIDSIVDKASDVMFKAVDSVLGDNMESLIEDELDGTYFEADEVLDYFPVDKVRDLITKARRSFQESKQQADQNTLQKMKKWGLDSVPSLVREKPFENLLRNAEEKIQIIEDELASKGEFSGELVARIMEDCYPGNMTFTFDEDRSAKMMHSHWKNHVKKAASQEDDSGSFQLADWTEESERKHPRTKQGKFARKTGDSRSRGQFSKRNKTASSHQKARKKRRRLKDRNSPAGQSRKQRKIERGRELRREQRMATRRQKTIDRVKSVLRVLNAWPSMTAEVVRHSGAGDRTAKLALVVATVLDNVVPMIPAGSVSILALTTLLRPQAPLKALHAAIDQSPRAQQLLDNARNLIQKVKHERAPSRDA